MNCERCGYEGNFIEENYAGNVILFCPNCYTNKNDWCKHENSVPAKYLVGGKWRVQKCCTVCHKLNGTFLKQSDLNLSAIKTIDKDKHDRYHDEQGKKYNDRTRALYELHHNWDKTLWFSEHAAYLKTIEWQEKRDEVLKRDNYLCQACLKARATQVHHLSYAHWRNEPLFELVSVCKECHDNITMIDNAKTN